MASMVGAAQSAPKAATAASALGGQWRSIRASESPGAHGRVRFGCARAVPNPPHGCAATAENEIGDPADELLNRGRDVRPQFQRGHNNSVYRRNQEMVKHWKIFSEAAHNLLVLASSAGHEDVHQKSPEDEVIGVATADGALAGEEGQLLEAEAFQPDAGAATLLHVDGKRIAVAGLGDEIDADAFRTAGAAVARLAKRIGGTLGWDLDEKLRSVEEQARAVVDGVVLVSTTLAAGRRGTTRRRRSPGWLSRGRTASSSLRSRPLRWRPGPTEPATSPTSRRTS